MIIALSPKEWWANIKRLETFQRRIQSERWPSLAELYPRNGMLVYAHLLFFWGRYCNILPDLLARPDRCLLAEIFLRYVCEIDAYVDSFDSQSVWRDDVNWIKQLSNVQAIISEFCSHLHQLDAPKPVKRSIVRAVANYRRRAVRAMRKWAESPSLDLTLTIEGKEATAGDLWRTWSCILNQVYAVSPDLANDACEIFFNFGMAVQVIDDLGDVPVDHKVNSRNLLLSLTHESTSEWQYLQDFLQVQSDLFLDWPWVRQHLPSSHQRTVDLYASYAARLLDARRRPQLATELYGALEKIRTLSG
jgi:hypothetical protein